MSNKWIRIIVLLSPTEKEALQSHARKLDRPVSWYVRNLIRSQLGLSEGATDDNRP